MRGAAVADHTLGIPGADPRTFALDLIDAHAGGDIGRVVLGGVENIPVGSVADRARFLRLHADGLRRLMISKPHGDPSQCLNLVVEPTAADAEFGLITMGTMGYPNFSGSNAMCTVAALVAAERLAVGADGRDVWAETPGGVSRLTASARDGLLDSVAYDSLPGFVLAGERRVDVDGWGTVPFAVAYGGVYYAIVSGADVDLEPGKTSVDELNRFLGAFFTAAAPTLDLWHPEYGAMPPLSLALLAGPLDEHPSATPSVDVAVYMHPGVICQSPTGTGTTALLAWLTARGEIAPTTTLRTISPYGNEFTGTLTGRVAVGEMAGVNTRIAGRPRLTSQSRVIVDFDDPLIKDNGLKQLLESSH